MIPIIHDSKEKYLGLLNDSECCYVIEERNGMFELELTYNLFSLNWDKLVRGHIIIAHANDTLLNQKFRIYKIGKTIRGKFSVFAKHISYDMQRDMIEGLDIQNQSCEYCLNEIFRKSKFSQKFRGYSDIINAQDYKIGATKLLSAIGGTKGSILDTFGTGAELLRDNENIHVLNRRGHDNGVTIEYSKNLTGLDITEDEDGLITRIRAIAKYTPEGGEETTISTYVDSPNIDKYETPFTETIDFSNKFENGDIPTTTKLEQLALAYFRDNQCDIFKGNYKIEFIPLSKCAGYEDIEDKISLCDIVHIKDYRYNLDDKAKIIKATYDPLKERYVSMEVGVPRSSLSDVISNNSNTVSRDEVKDIINNSTAKFPNTLPSTPILSYKLYGFSNIELSWTFENKIYYNYELYASKTKDFTPNVFDIIHQGQSSSFLFQAKPNETWYFKVCAVNSHGNRTGFSTQIAVTTTKIDDLSNYVDNMAIGDALIGELNLGRGWFGQLKGNHIDAKQLSVTDGNGKRTLDIDSFGNVSLDVTQLRINSNSVATSPEVEALLSDNLIENSIVDMTGWNKTGSISKVNNSYNNKDWANVYGNYVAGTGSLTYEFNTKANKKHIFSVLVAKFSDDSKLYRIRLEGYSNNSWHIIKEFAGETEATRDNPEEIKYSFTSTSQYEKYRVGVYKISDEILDFYITDFKVVIESTLVRKAEFKILEDEISQKVSEDNFGTLVEQNAYAVKIAWNNNSKYVQFENGALNIYDGAVTTSKKRMSLDQNGNHFWRDGYYLGKIGTNQYYSNSSIKGITFDLDHQGGYMSWATKKTSADQTYTMKWTYANKTIGNYEEGKLHAGADIDMHYRYLRNVNFEGGGINGTLIFTQIVGMNSNGTAARWYNNSKLVFQNGILIDGTWGNV